MGLLTVLSEGVNFRFAFPSIPRSGLLRKMEPIALTISNYFVDAKST
jgi:hypothetical protein